MPNIESSPMEDAAKKAMKQYEDATKAYADKQRAQADAARSAFAAPPAPLSTAAQEQKLIERATPEAMGGKGNVYSDPAMADKAMADRWQAMGADAIERQRKVDEPAKARAEAMVAMGDAYKAGKEVAPPVATPEAKAEAKKTRVAELISQLAAETGKKSGPSLADIIEASSAGWSGRKAAYLEKQESEKAREAAASELTQRAQLEEALQDERLAQELKIAQLKLGGIAPPSLASLTPAQAAAAKFAASLGGQ